MSDGNAAAMIRLTVERITQTVEREVVSRAYRVSNVLRNSAIYTLRGPSPSPPGSPPGVRGGVFRNSWQPGVRIEKGGSGLRAVSQIENPITVTGRSRTWVLGELLEEGTRKMAARPYQEKIKEHAKPEIERIYSEPFNI